MDHWIGEWRSYDFAAGSFHTKKLCSRLFSREVEFYWLKQRYHVFVPPYGGLKGNVHGSSMARWKARGRLPMSANWTFSASYHGWGSEPTLVEISLFERGWVSLNANFRAKGRPPPTNFGIRKLESLGYRLVKKISENFSRLSRVHQRYRQTDDRRRTDDSIRCSRFTCAQKLTRWPAQSSAYSI